MKTDSGSAALILRLAAFAAAVAALAGCEVKYEKLMSDAAVATADRVCGVYRLTDASWDGAPLDLDCDGVASGSFMDECLKGDFLGWVLSDGENLDVHIYAIQYGSEKPVKIYIPFFQGDYTLPLKQDGMPTYSLNSIDAEYSILEDGTLSIDCMSTQRHSSHGPQGAFCDVWDIELTWDRDGDGDFILSGTTRFIDRISGNEVEGRETLRYHCISTKEKKKR